MLSDNHGRNFIPHNQYFWPFLQISRSSKNSYEVFLLTSRKCFGRVDLWDISIKLWKFILKCDILCYFLSLLSRDLHDGQSDQRVIKEGFTKFLTDSFLHIMIITHFFIRDCFFSNKSAAISYNLVIKTCLLQPLRDFGLEPFSCSSYLCLQKRQSLRRLCSLVSKLNPC